MEKNIHDDRLEDYVRKSFEDFEEAPASDMWDRIERDMPPPDRRRIRPLFWQLSAAAAILLLLSGLVCGRLYYQNRIQQIVGQQIPPAPPTPPSPALSAGHKTNATTKNPAGTDQPNNPASTPAAPPTPRNKGAVSPGNHAFTRSSLAIKNQHLLTPVPEIPVVPKSAEAPMEASVSLIINNLPPIRTLPAPLVFKPFVLDKPIIHPVQPTTPLSGWYLGLHLTPVVLVDQPGPERSGNLRPRLVSIQEKTTFSADYWLRFGKKGKGILGFESGLGYRTIERNATHMARFRLANGRPNTGGGTQERSYDFDYDLDTYGGSAQVTLRMDQVDPGAVIPDNEPLRIQVKTSERMALLRVPVLATASLGKERWQAVLKAGLTGNIVIINELDIVTRVSENVRFRPAQGSNGYTLYPDKAGKFFPGYQFSAGLEYRLGRHLSGVLEPALSGDFARKNNAGRQLPGILTFGINVGLNYRFEGRNL